MGGEDIGGAEEDAVGVEVEFEGADGEFEVGAHEEFADEAGAAVGDVVAEGGADGDGVHFGEGLDVEADAGVVGVEVGLEDFAGGDAAGGPVHEGEGLFDGEEERGRGGHGGGVFIAVGVGRANKMLAEGARGVQGGGLRSDG